jgi:NAD(P)-dependent dehydrogenase (short-subunit alcohol dehydrogenase family)
MKDLAGKVAVVTGGGGGIGAATGRLLGEQGMRVVLADVNEERLDATVTARRDAGIDAIGVVTDVTDFASVQALADAAYDAFGAVHVLHLNAGIGGGGSLFDDVTADWERVLGVNLKGVIWGIKAFVSRMIEDGEEGFVVATSSGAGADGTSYKTASYAATKIAVVSIMECLHGQLRDKGSRIHAGVAFPPLAATNLAGSPEAMKGVESMLRGEGIPTTLVQPEGVAKLILDGIQRDRFFFRVGHRESKECFDGAISDDFVAWNERMIRGRAEAVLADGTPDAYLW